MSLRKLSPLFLGLALAIAPLSAKAESNSWIAFGLGAGLTYSSPQGAQTASLTHFNFNARLKMFKFLGIDMMFAPGAGRYATGEQAPSLRLTALLYILNFRAFSLFGAAGMTGRQLGDLVDVNGAETRYRAGGGTEITFDGHYSLGLEGYWMVPSAGMVDQQVKAAHDLGQSLSRGEAFATNGFELYVGFRYFF